MTRMLAFGGLFLLLAGASSAQPTEDISAIRTIVNHWQQMWDSFDSSYLKDDYADDADWLNAFGVRFQGRAKILEFMAGMMKRPNMQGRKTTWEEPRIRFLRPDVAIAYRDYKTVGQNALDGRAMPERNTHGTWVLTKDAGKWHISSQVISDSNAPQNR